MPVAGAYLITISLQVQCHGKGPRIIFGVLFSGLRILLNPPAPLRKQKRKLFG
jgi:hypothetical protein